jgi:hypothetical protein
MNSMVLTIKKTKQVVLNVSNSKYTFFIELIKNFDFVQIKDDNDDDNQGDSKEEIIANLMQAFKELKLIKEGKLKTTPAKEFLNEL